MKSVDITVGARYRFREWSPPAAMMPGLWLHRVGRVVARDGRRFAVEYERQKATHERLARVMTWVPETVRVLVPPTSILEQVGGIELCDVCWKADAKVCKACAVDIAAAARRRRREVPA